MKTFEAKYRGRCAVCNETIHPGDDVGYEDDELIHAGCEGSVPVDIISRVFRTPYRTRDEVCPVCSLDHAGECP